MTGLTQRVLTGSLWSFGGQWAALVASLIATPFTIRLLGTDAYGVLGLITVLLSYVGVADVGMGFAATRFSAAERARQDDRGEVAVVWTALAVATAPAALAALGMIASARFLAEHVFQLPEALHDAVTLALQVAALVFVARTVASILAAPQTARLRLDLVTLIDSGTAVLQIGLIPLVLWWSGGGLVAAVMVSAGANALAVLLHALWAWRAQPQLVRPRVRLSLAGPLLRYGLFSSAVVFGALLLLNLEKLLLVRLVSSSALAHYTVAFTVARLLMLLPIAFARALTPAFVGLQEQTDLPKAQALYSRALRGLLAWNVPFGLLIGLVAVPFLTVWAGPEYGRESALPLYILVMGCLFDGMGYVPRTFLGAVGRPDLVARVQWWTVLPYSLLVLALTVRWGTAGAAAAWSLRTAAEYVALSMTARRAAGTPLPLLPSGTRSYEAVLLTVILPSWFVTLRYGSFLLAAGVCLSALVVHAIVAWRLVLTPDERQWMTRVLRPGRGPT